MLDLYIKSLDLSLISFYELKDYKANDYIKKYKIVMLSYLNISTRL